MCGGAGRDDGSKCWWLVAGTLVTYLLNDMGEPYMLLANNAAHTRNLLNNPKVESAAFVEAPVPVPLELLPLELKATHTRRLLNNARSRSTSRTPRARARRALASRLSAKFRRSRRQQN